MNGVVGLLTLARSRADRTVRPGFGTYRHGVSCPSGNPDRLGRDLLFGAWVVLVSPLEERCPCAVALALLEPRLALATCSCCQI